MKCRVMVELIGSDGIAHAHEVNAGGSNTAECSAEMVGLTLADGKRTLAGLQDHLVQAQTREYCRQRRLCSHCGSQRPLKDVRARRSHDSSSSVHRAAWRDDRASPRPPRPVSVVDDVPRFEWSSGQLCIWASISGSSPSRG